MAKYSEDEMNQAKRDIAKVDELLLKVPKNYPDWYYQKVIDFKSAVKKAQRLNGRNTPQKIRSVILELESYYK